MIVAALIGIAFGFCLERGGMGNARKLADQFYLRDFTVIKVMFSALITAMLGTFWLARAGIVDHSFFYVPDTFLIPQAIGGVLFGAGFVVGGLCPGTSCVAAASGRMDGFAVIAGMFVGAMTFGLAFSRIERIYHTTARGIVTLPSFAHVTYGAMVALVVTMAIAMFAVADRIEARSTTDVA